MKKVYIGLGSNVGQRSKHLNAALKYLITHPHIYNVHLSPIYQSSPIGPDQRFFLNAVVVLETTLKPLDVLDLLQNIETQRKRKRSQHWGPRTLDLDILLYAKDKISSPRLNVPHPYLTQRKFVLKPLADLNPSLKVPGHKNTVKKLLQQLDDPHQKLQLWSGSSAFIQRLHKFQAANTILNRH